MERRLSSFERQRREQQALLGKAIKKQEERRKHLQSFVDRFRACGDQGDAGPVAPEDARQHGSRSRRWSTIPSRLPLAADRPQLSPPIVAMEGVSVGYGERVVLSKLDLTLADDDRVGLLGANGNGKSTFAKLVAGRLTESAASWCAPRKLDVGFFAQHQVDDLDPDGTPYATSPKRMRGAPDAKIRARAAQIGFSGDRADTPDRGALGRREGARC